MRLPWEEKLFWPQGLNSKPNIPSTGTHAEAHRKLQEKLQYFKKRLEEFRSNRLALMNKDRQHYGFTVGQIVYMYNPSGSQLQTTNRKFNVNL